MNTTSFPVLVLDTTYMPVNIVPAKRAISYLVRDKATIVENGISGKALISEKETWEIPSIIKLSEFIGRSSLSNIKVKFNKRTLLERDKNQCQYCSKKLGRDVATIDHVIPKSHKHSGKTVWTNCVIACKDCNSKKANRTPQEARMPLKKVPISPHYITHLSRVLERHMKDNGTWKQYFIF